MSRLLISEMEKRYEPWFEADNSLEVIDIGHCIAHLPRAEPRANRPDGLVMFMQEAYRCLKPGGTLTVHTVAASTPLAVADPEAVRFFNAATWLHFAKPASADDWVWGKYGKDWGTRFSVVHEVTGDDASVITMEKPCD